MHEPAQLVEASANRAELLLTVSAYRQKFTDILLGAGLEESSGIFRWRSISIRSVRVL
jgi:hypothetical protein